MKDFDIMLGVIVLLNFVKFSYVVNVVSVVIEQTKKLVSAFRHRHASFDHRIAVDMRLIRTPKGSFPPPYESIFPH